MCGIGGILRFDGAPADPGALARMNIVMEHRGPDDAGVWTDGPLGLAVRRLAIIDLSEAGHQPMSNEDGTVWVAFNGEIYNYVELMAELQARGHRFRSHCDTEVIVHAYEEWGHLCLEHFNGMFGIAIWDQAVRRLWLARDRLGVKGLYYWVDDEKIVFGSEIKVLREVPGVGLKAHPGAIAEYLHRSFSTTDQTWFAGIRKVMPGQQLVITTEGRVTPSSYWDPIDAFRSAAPAGDSAEHIRSLLEDSVRLRLRSDVPLGAHLSGGLDSSTVVALMSRQLSRPVHTFSGAFAEGGEFDEREFIKIMVEAFKTEHHEVIPRGEDLPEILPKLIWHMDEPTAGPGVYPQYMVCKLTHDQGVKVVNGGQGGDELFGGYPKYLATLARMNAGESRRSAVEAAAAAFTAWRFRFTPRRVLGGAVSRLLPVMHPALKRGFDPGALGLPHFLDDPLSNEMYNDIRYYLPALLQVEDRTSMAVSIESRIPFLDYRVVELAASIPYREKLADGWLKKPLRDAMAGTLPAPIVDRRDKRGFPTPINVWFREGLHDWLEDLLLNRAFVDTNVFTRPRVKTALLMHRSGAAEATQFLWMATNVALWFQQFKAEPTW